MVARLLDKGHTVTGYNRTRSKAVRLIDKGMKLMTASGPWPPCRILPSSMVTTQQLYIITEGPDGILAGLSAAETLIDMSTVSPARSRGSAAKVCEKWGVDMIDSPVSAV